MPVTPTIDKGFVRSQELFEELRADIDIAYAALDKDRRSQYLRRCVVRAIFCYIEAMIECIKVELRSAVRTGLYTGKLTDREIETLGPLAIISVKNSGKFLPLDQNIKRTFRLAVKIWGLQNFHLSTGSEDYRDFLAAKSARNRLTHPRTFYDIEVTDGDMHCHTIAGMWAEAEMQRLIDVRIRALADSLPADKRAAFLRDFGRRKQVRTDA